MNSEDSSVILQRAASLVAQATIVQGVLHEVHNGVISIYYDVAALMREKICQDSPPAMKRLGLIKETADRLDRLVGRTRQLQLGRWPESEKVGLTKVEEAIEEAIRLVSPQRCKIVLRSQSSSFLCEVPGSLLIQVFVNLLQNSLEANASAVAIALSAEKGKREEEVVVRIEDNGIGVAKDVLDRVFEPFFTTKESSVGLGLSVARQLLLQYGGELTLQPKGRRGTIAVLRLPLKDEVKKSDELHG